MSYTIFLKITNFFLIALILIFLVSNPSWALIVQDPTGDTAITDITRMRYEIKNGFLEIDLSFMTILADTFITIKIDADKSLVTGFTVGCGYGEPSPFGVDYTISIEMGSLPISTKSYITYQKFTSDPNNPLIDIENINIPIGDSIHPNGSSFIQNGNQIYLKIPISLFNNEQFPVYTPNTKSCVKNLFPNSSRAFDLARAYVSVRTEIFYYPGNYDQLPDRGMVDAEAGNMVGCYPVGSENLIKNVIDLPNDSILNGILGDEILALAAYRHQDGNLSFLLQLSSLASSNDSVYALNFDLDNNSATGLQVSNGTTMLGSDITANLQNWNNIGSVTPLYADLSFGNDLYCVLPYSHLGNSKNGTPGYIWFTLPKEISHPWTTINQSGFIKVFGFTLNPIYPHYSRDEIPNSPSEPIAIPYSSRSFPPDFNGDGKADLAGVNSTDQIYYTINLSTWTNIPGQLSQLLVGDFDGDGKADDLAGLNAAGKVYYTTNLSTWRNIPGSLSKIVVGDFDGDGKADDLAGLNGAGKVYYTTNLSAWRNIPGTLSKIVVGDFDGDGKADDLAGLNGAGKVYYTTNLSTWRNIPGSLSKIVVGDFDGDGKADDLAGLNGAGNVYYTTNLSTWRNIPGKLNRLAGGDD